MYRVVIPDVYSIDGTVAVLVLTVQCVHKAQQPINQSINQSSFIVNLSNSAFTIKQFSSSG